MATRSDESSHAGGNILSIEESTYESQIERIIGASSTDREAELREFVRLLPPVTDFGFEYALTILLERTNNSPGVYDEVTDFLYRIIDEPDPAVDRDGTFVRFVGFHGASIHLYKAQNVSEWGDLHAAKRHYFAGWDGRPMYEFNYAMYLYYTDDELQIKEAHNILHDLRHGELRDNPGVLNAYVVCTLKRLDARNLECSEEEIADARDAMERAIELYEFAGYYINLGRLQGRLGEYDAGIENVQRGMDMEPADNKEKLSRYRNYITTIELERQKAEVDTYVEQMKGEVETARDAAQEVRSETLQFLGFFAAIITFIVTSVQFATAFDDFTRAASLIPLLTGCLVLAFSVLRFLFVDDPFERPSPLLAVWGIGLLLIGLSGAIYAAV